MGQGRGGGHPQGFVVGAFERPEDVRRGGHVLQARQGGDGRDLPVAPTRCQRCLQQSHRGGHSGRVAPVAEPADAGQFALGGRGSRRRGTGVLHADARDPVHAAQHVGLPELRARATQLVPAARVEDEHRTVVVGEHVGGVEVDAAAHHEIAVLGPERRALAFEPDAGDLPQIEGRGEEVARVVRAKRSVIVGGQSARGGRAELRDGMGQGRAGPEHRPIFHHRVGLAEDGAERRMGHAVAESGLGKVDERAGEEGIAVGVEDHVHRIVHAPGHHRLQGRTIGTRPENVGRLVLMDGAGEAIGPADGFEGALGPVDQAVGPGVGPMHLIAAMGRRMTHVPPLVASVGPAVAVGIGEFPDGRSAAHIHRALMPQDALEHGQFVGEDDRPVIAAIAIGVFEPNHPPLRVLGLGGRRFGGAAGIRDVQAAPVIESPVHGPCDLIGRGHGFDLKALGQGEIVGTDLTVGGTQGNGCEGNGQSETEAEPKNRSGACEQRCHGKKGWESG